MGNSQSTRKRTSSLRAPGHMGRHKSEHSYDSEVRPTKTTPTLHESAGEGFSMSPKAASNESIEVAEFKQRVDNMMQPNIPIVTITGN